jgi:IS4 transposase
VIDLSLKLFDWARFRRAKGAVKLHLALDHDGYLPCFAVLTDGRRHEVKVAHELHFAPGTIVIMDRGYNDYALFGRWTREGVYFVTRMKRPSAYEVIETRPCIGDGVLKDEIIEFNRYWEARQTCPERLRRIEFVPADTNEVLVFLTNHLKLSASTIAAVYKQRWQVELFFKAIKQNLRVKTFVGTTSNAVRTQMFSAMIAMLLLRFLQLKSRFGWHLSNLVALLRMNLFTHRDLWTWIDQPFGESHHPPNDPVQASLLPV